MLPPLLDEAAEEDAGVAAALVVAALVDVELEAMEAADEEIKTAAAFPSSTAALTPDEVLVLAPEAAEAKSFAHPVMGLSPGSFSSTPVISSGTRLAILQEVDGSFNPPMRPGH